jgi:hypothetical protein
VIESALLLLDWFTCHLDTRSLEDIAKKVESASVATALARYDLPVPGGPYSRMPEDDMISGSRIDTGHRDTENEWVVAEEE